MRFVFRRSRKTKSESICNCNTFYFKNELKKECKVSHNHVCICDRLRLVNDITIFDGFKFCKAQYHRCICNINFDSCKSIDHQCSCYFKGSNKYKSIKNHTCSCILKKLYKKVYIDKYLSRRRTKLKNPLETIILLTFPYNIANTL